MIINDKWELRSGPQNHDYTLVEKVPYHSEKYNETRYREISRYYPTLEMAAKAMARVEGIEAIDLETVDEVVSQLKQVEELVLKVLEAQND